MGEAKRYRVSRCGRYVVDYEEAAVCEDAARITRLLNAEEAVRAALDAAASYIHHVEESEARHVGREGSIPSPTLAKVRAALSALDAEAVRP